MDIEILKRKTENKNYIFPKCENGLVLYKQFTAEKDGIEKTFTVESSPLTNKTSLMSGFTICIYKFTDESLGEEKAVSVFCKNLSEVDMVCDNIEKLIAGNAQNPFDLIFKESNMEFRFKKNGWVKI